MKILATFSEILEAGEWNTFCDMKGYSPYMMNEGTADPEDTVLLTMKEAKILNLL
jgi:hypothetical protein